MKKPFPEIVQVPFPGEQTGKLKDVGGLNRDDFNNVLARQLVNTLCWISTRILAPSNFRGRLLR